MTETSRRLQLLVALFVLVLGLSSAIVDDHIAELDAKSFQKQVLDSKNPYMVFFYDSDLLTEEAMVDALKEMETTLQTSVSPYGVGFASFDCAKKRKGNRANVKICGTVGLTTIPGIGMYTDVPEINPYSNKNGRTIKMYQGQDPTDLKKIERSFVNKHYPIASIKSIKSSSGDIEGELEEHLDKAKEEGKHALLIFNSKDTVSLFTKSVCHAFNNLPCITVGGMDTGDINTKLGVAIEELPALVVRSPDGTASLYPSEFKATVAENREEVLSWVNDATGYEASQEAEATADASAGDESDVRKRKMRANSEDELLAVIKKTPAATFQANALEEDGSWLLLVSTTGHEGLSEADGANWRKLVQASEGAVQPEEVICGESEEGASYGHVLCKERSLPYILMVPYGDEDEREGILSSPIRKSHIYELSDCGKAKSAALNSLPDEVSYLSESELEQFIALSFGSNRLGLLVMSDKEEAPAMLRNVRWTLNKEGIAHVGFLNDPSANLLGQLGMPADMQLPAVFVLHQAKEQPAGAPPGAGAATSLVPYDPMMFGPLKFRSLLNFVLSVYQNSGAAHAAQQNAADSHGEAADASPFGNFAGNGEAAAPVQITSEQEWQEECGPNFKGICTLAFTKKGQEEAVADINTAVISRLTKANKAAAFKFLVVDGPCQLSFSDRFDVSYELMPTYAIYAPAKGRAASFKESVSEEKVFEFLEGVLKGKMNTFPLAQRPTFGTECEMDEAAMEAMGEAEEEPMDDFLEEIRREEEERQAALKKELQEEQKKRKEEEKAAKEAKEAPRKVKKVIKKKSKKKAKTEL